MRVTRSATLLSRQKERQEITLMPEEILIRIWSFLDFDTLQKICVLVSKSWFDKIRNSMKLSGEFYLNAYENYYHRPGQRFVPSIGIIEKTMCVFNYGQTGPFLEVCTYILNISAISLEYLTFKPIFSCSKQAKEYIIKVRKRPFLSLNDFFGLKEAEN